MKFGIIGAGIVGTALAVGLEAAGHECIGVNTRSNRSYERFRQYLSKDLCSLEEMAAAADGLFITTQDDMIEVVAENLSRQLLHKSGQVWIHCSGSLPSSILRRRGDLPVCCLSVHTLQAFASIEKALEILPGTHFGLEGDAPEFAEGIVKDLGGVPHHISASQKSLYHAGAVVASNYLVVLASLAEELFAEVGIKGDEALASLLPLMRGTLFNLEKVGLPYALTGPVARGDVSVVAGHLQHMPAKQKEIYRELGLKALELGEAKKAKQGLAYSPEDFKALKSLLEEKH